MPDVRCRELARTPRAALLDGAEQANVYALRLPVAKLPAPSRARPRQLAD